MEEGDMEKKGESIFPEEQICMEELQYDMSIKVMSVWCQFGLIQSPQSQ